MPPPELPAPGTRLRWPQLAALALLGLLFLLPGLFTLPPLDRDEPRYAQASKQMVSSGNYHDIHFQQETRYKKPIGIYWLQSASNLVFGAPPYDTIWPYRLPSLIGGILTLALLAAGLARLTDARTGLIAALVLASCAQLHFESRIGKTDAVLLACITGAQMLLAAAYRGPLTARQAYGFWLLQAGAILIKGPIGPLVSLLTIATLAFADRQVVWLKRLRPARGFMLCAALVLPWLIIIGLASDGKFYGEAVGHDLLGKIFEGQDRGWLPPGYHSLLLFAFFLPQITLLLAALAAAWRARHAPLPRFALAWLAPLWVVYELIATKLPHYVLPAYPALALLAALLLTGSTPFPDGKFWRCAARLQTAALILLAGAIAAAAFYLHANPALVLAASLGAGLLAWRQASYFQRQPIAAMLCGFGSGNLLLVALFGAILPGTAGFWLSPQIAATYFENRRCSFMSRLVTNGYNEPSLVLLAGTNTLFANGGDYAAKILQQDACAVAVVRDGQEQEFLAELAANATPVEKTGQVAGFNYNGGGWQTLQFYRLALPSRFAPAESYEALWQAPLNHPLLYPAGVSR